MASLRRELELVACDDVLRRFVYCVHSERVTHDNGALQVFGAGERRSRVVWSVDLLPNEIAEYVARQMDAAVAVMKPALER